MAIGAIIGAGASILGGLLGKSGSDKALKAQQAAQAAALARLDKVYEQGRSDLGPALDAGNLAQQVLLFERGLRPDAPIIGQEGFRVGGKTYATEAEARRALDAATSAFNAASTVRTPVFASDDAELAFAASSGQMGANGFEQTFDPARGVSAAGFDPRGASVEALNPQRYQGFALSPGQEFIRNEALEGITARASQMGSRNSGATNQALLDRGMDITNTFREQYLASLGALSAQGQNAATSLLGAGSGVGTQAANIITSGGNAAGANAIQGANSLAQGLTLGVNALTNNVDFGGLNNIFGTTGATGAGGISGVTF